MFVTQLQGEQLQAVIEGPARKVGVSLDSDESPEHSSQRHDRCMKRLSPEPEPASTVSTKGGE